MCVQSGSAPEDTAKPAFADTDTEHHRSTLAPRLCGAIFFGRYRVASCRKLEHGSFEIFQGYPQWVEPRSGFPGVHYAWTRRFSGQVLGYSNFVSITVFPATLDTAM